MSTQKRSWLRHNPTFFSKAQRLSTASFSLFFMPNEEPNGGVQFAVIVGKKVSKKAFLRNKIKRIVRAELRELVHKKQLQKVRLVVAAKPQVATYSNADLRAAVRKVMAAFESKYAKI